MYCFQWGSNMIILKNVVYRVYTTIAWLYPKEMVKGAFFWSEDDVNMKFKFMS